VTAFEVVSIPVREVSVPKGDLPPPPHGKYPPRSLAFDQLQETLKREGMKLPVFVSPEGVLLSGHYRFWAAQALGWRYVRAVIVKSLREVAAYFGEN
jgi:ParB-like chromosome segregation protein Spo0J